MLSFYFQLNMCFTIKIKLYNFTISDGLNYAHSPISDCIQDAVITLYMQRYKSGFGKMWPAGQNCYNIEKSRVFF